jgi:N-acetylglutamate synthase-like GNAT family acetyltransferase
MTLRFARESDLPKLMALINKAFQVERFFLGGDRLNPEETRQYFAKGRFLIAEEDGVSAGCVYVELRGDRCYLGLLSVDPERQKNGIGRQLVSAAEGFARQSRAREMDLTVVNLRTELPPFYEKLGYRIICTEPPRPELASRANQPCHSSECRNRSPDGGTRGRPLGGRTEHQHQRRGANVIASRALTTALAPRRRWITCWSP